MEKKLFELYREMLRIEMTENEIADRYHANERKMHTPIHLCNGQEAIAVGVCRNLKKEDMVFSNHRCHGHYLAKGGDLRKMIAELHSKETGCCKGKGGSMHLCDMGAGVALTSAIVAGNVPIATGSALADKLRKTGNITCVFLGDGATEEGAVFESISFAALKKLPILYVCENNQYAINTPLSEREIFCHVSEKFAKIIPVFTGDGNDVMEVYQLAKKCIENIRMGGGPVFVEWMTYRIRNHSNSDNGIDGRYRTQEEWERWNESNPLRKAERQLLSYSALYEDKIEACRKSIAKEIEEAFSFAEQSVFPKAEELYDNVWG